MLNGPKPAEERFVWDCVFLMRFKNINLLHWHSITMVSTSSALSSPYSHLQKDSWSICHDPTSAVLASLHWGGALHILASVCLGNAQGEKTQRESYTKCITLSLPTALAPYVASRTVSRNAHECLWMMSEGTQISTAPCYCNKVMLLFTQ